MIRAKAAPLRTLGIAWTSNLSNLFEDDDEYENENNAERQTLTVVE